MEIGGKKYMVDWEGEEIGIFGSNTMDITLNILYSNIDGGTSEIHLGYPTESLIWGDGNLTSDPLFVDGGVEGTNYYLTDSSPCIDAGNPDLDGDGNDYNNDLDDQDSDGTRMDIGAYHLTKAWLQSYPQKYLMKQTLVTFQSL